MVHFIVSNTSQGKCNSQKKNLGIWLYEYILGRAEKFLNSGVKELLSEEAELWHGKLISEGFTQAVLLSYYYPKYTKAAFTSFTASSNGFFQIKVFSMCDY